MGFFKRFTNPAGFKEEMRKRVQKTKEDTYIEYLKNLNGSRQLADAISDFKLPSRWKSGNINNSREVYTSSFVSTTPGIGFGGNKLALYFHAELYTGDPSVEYHEWYYYDFRVDIYPKADTTTDKVVLVYDLYGTKRTTKGQKSETKDLTSYNEEIEDVFKLPAKIVAHFKWN